MTSKSFSTEVVPSITPNMERTAAMAFNEFAKRSAPAKMFNGVLKRFPYNSSSACKHSWKLVGSLPKEHADYLKLITEEEPPVGGTKWCSGCGAVSYWENGKLWLFDATTKFFGRPPKRNRHDRRESTR